MTARPLPRKGIIPVATSYPAASASASLSPIEPIWGVQ